jgi:hypothetical protein
VTDPDKIELLREVCARFVAEASVDYVGFWEIVEAVAEKSLSDSDQEHTHDALILSKCLIENGLRVFKFDVGTTTPVFWNNLSPEAAVNRIREEWRLLGGQAVGLGDVCWFAKPAS